MRLQWVVYFNLGNVAVPAERAVVSVCLNERNVEVIDSVKRSLHHFARWKRDLHCHLRSGCWCCASPASAASGHHSVLQSFGLHFRSDTGKITSHRMARIAIPSAVKERLPGLREIG